MVNDNQIIPVSYIEKRVDVSSGEDSGEMRGTYVPLELPDESIAPSCEC